MVKPRRMNKNASVTIKLGKPVRTTMMPFSAPMAIHSAKVSRIATQIGQPSVTDMIAIDIPAKPIIDPTLRSNSPAIINIQAPTAMIMNCAETVDQFSTPWALNMPLSPAKMMKKAKTATVPTIAPNSGRISAFCSFDVSLMRSSTVASVLDIARPFPVAQLKKAGADVSTRLDALI